MMCSHGLEGRSLSQYGHFSDKGGQIFRNFVPASFMDALGRFLMMNTVGKPIFFVLVVAICFDQHN